MNFTCIATITKYYLVLHVTVHLLYLQAQVLEYLKLFCTHNRHGDYCLELLDKFNSRQLQLPYDDMDVSYIYSTCKWHKFVIVLPCHECERYLVHTVWFMQYITFKTMYP